MTRPFAGGDAMPATGAGGSLPGITSGRTKPNNRYPAVPCFASRGTTGLLAGDAQGFNALGGLERAPCVPTSTHHKSNFRHRRSRQSGRLRTSGARMCPIRILSPPTDPQPAVPACPGCRDSAFVKQEQVLTGGTAISFWTCSSCLRSWPAPKPRMAKADLSRAK